MPVFPLSEGSFTIGHDKIFVPFHHDTHVLNERPVGSLLVEVQPFLVVTGDDIILLDTGLGFNSENGTLQIHDNLSQLGYTPGQVTKVLLSHLHKDHAGGVMQADENGLAKAAFPNAAYFIYRAEADYALEVGFPSYHPAELEPLLSSGQVVWLEGMEGRINEFITFRHSGGHCPHHIVYLIEDGDETLFFGGDEAPQLKQLKIKYVAKYDFDGRKAMMLREQWAEEGRKAGWKFLFYHDIQIPVSQLAN